MKVAIIGTVGVPACYGGFESLVENIIGENCPPDVHYTIFCSSKNLKTRLTEYKGATLKYISLSANGISSILYDTISVWRTLKGYDAVLLLGCSTPLLGILSWFRKGKLIYNVDGISHTRDKYGRFAKFYLYHLKKHVIKHADTLVSDNIGIQKYIQDEFHRDSALIAYGGDHVLRSMSQEIQSKIIADYGLQAGSYAITVCRIEPENNCHIILEAFAALGETMVFIGNWNKSQYGIALREQYKNHRHIHLLDPIYDLEKLYALRNNARYYIHGHSVGGTNPSLVEAMFFGKPILAYDVIYNRETTFHKAHYFTTAEDLQHLLTKHLTGGDELAELAKQNYTWKHIAEQYHSLYL